MARNDGLARRTIAWKKIIPRYLAVYPVLNFLVFANFIEERKFFIQAYISSFLSINVSKSMDGNIQYICRIFNIYYIYQ